MYELSLSITEGLPLTVRSDLLKWSIERSIAFAESVREVDIASTSVTADLEEDMSQFDHAPVVFYFSTWQELIDFEAQTQRLWPGSFSYSVRKIHDSGWLQAWLESNDQSSLIKTKIVPVSMEAATSISNQASLSADLVKHSSSSDTILIHDQDGLAFGNGLHRATNVLIYWLEELPVRHPTRPISRMSLLDVGFGTGLLSIKAKKIGFKTVVGTEIDPVLVDLGRKNAKINDCHDIYFLLDHKLNDWCAASSFIFFDVVLCNIQTAGQLTLHDLFGKVLTEDGLLVVSGFMECDVPIIVESLSTRNFILMNTISDHGWVACEFIKQI